MLQNTPIQKISVYTLLALGILIFGVRLTVIKFFAVAIPYWDDWGMGGFLYNYHTAGISFQQLFQDINQHRQVFGKLLAILLFELNHQQWDVELMMIANAIIWTISGLLLINIARSHQQEINPVPITLLILVVWCYPISLVNAVWGVQSHVYFMTLFAILGCWYSGAVPFSKKWCIGIFCLFAGGLTLAGGSFIAMAVAATYLILTIFDTQHRQRHLWTFIFASIATLFGIGLILIQPGTSSFIENLSSFDAFITFAKTMSWPVRQQIWPFFLFIIPILVILINVIKTKRVNTKLIPFVLSLYGFVILIAIAVAAARAADGAGPARRYADFLALGFVASSFALLIIQKNIYTLSSSTKKGLIIAWAFAIIVAIPLRIETTQFTLSDRAEIIPFQEKYIRRFINTHEDKHLVGKTFRHVPFPRPKSLANYLVDFEDAGILPYFLQKPVTLTLNPEGKIKNWADSAFIPNGLHLPHRDILLSEGWFGENVIGSFFDKNGGMKDTGVFESNTFRIDRSYAMIPVIGYAGHSEMTLKLVDVINGNEIDIEPYFDNTISLEDWREVQIKVKRGYYKYVAEDNSEAGWFGFAAPRSVGRLSHFTQKLLQASHFVWLFSIAFLCFCYREPLIRSISNIHSSNNSYG